MSFNMSMDDTCRWDNGMSLQEQQQEDELASHRKSLRNLRCLLLSDTSQSDKAPALSPRLCYILDQRNYRRSKKLSGYQGFSRVGLQ